MPEKKFSNLQKKLYLFYTEDGFIDLAIGFVILFFGLSLLPEFSWMVGIATILPLLGWYIAKEKITRYRTGIIHQNSSMKHRFSNFYLFLIIFGILILALLILSNINGKSILLKYPLSIFGLILALGISGLAILLHTNRFYIHAAIIFISMTIGEYLNPYCINMDTYIFATIIAAFVIICIGFFLSIRFLKNFPVIEIRTTN